MNYLNQIYWNFYRKWPKYHLAIYSEGNFVLELITQLLVEAGANATAQIEKEQALQQTADRRGDSVDKGTKKVAQPI
ncbi:hypothetical protein L1887_63334 [Cichorium endivia]|nr:hypothetical protein L1887_63334 [Cichorium endivia]